MSRKQRNLSIWEVLNSVVTMARRFQHRSMFDLFRDSQYASNAKDITVVLLKSAFEARPELMDDWVEYSENQRWSPVSYIEESSNGVWRVAYYDGNVDRRIKRFHDRAEATASFVKREMDHMLELTLHEDHD